MTILLAVLMSFNAYSAMPIVKATLNPSAPKVGDTVFAALELTTSFQSPDSVRTFIIASLDNAPVSLNTAAERFYFANLGSFSQVGAHSIKAEVFIEDRQEADAARAQISALTIEIANLQNELAHETDPDRRANFQSQISAKQNEEFLQEQLLASLQKKIGENNFAFSVTAVSVAVIEITPPVIPDTVAGGSNTFPLEFRNTGQAPATNGMATINGPAFSLDNAGNCTGTIAPGGSCSANVRFTPPTIGIHNLELIVSYFNGVSPVQLVQNYSGNGINAPSPHFAISDGPIFDFGSFAQGAPMPTHEFTITNAGGGAGNIAPMPSDNSLGLTGTPFSYQGGTCDALIPVQPQHSCTIIVGLSTASSVSADANMTMSFSPGAQLLSVELKGTITAAPLPQVKLSASTATITEGAGGGSFLIFLLQNSPDNQPVKVHYTITGTASASRYTLPQTGEITLGSTAGTYPTSIGLIDDNIFQGDQTIIVTLDQVTSGNAALGPTTVETITVHDNETPPLPEVNLGVSTAEITEGATTGAFKVWLTHNSPDGQPVKVHYTITGTASSSRYTLPPTGELTLPGSGAAGAFSFDLGLINDQIFQGNQTIVVTLDSITSGNAALGSPIVETITVHDDEVQTVHFIVSDISVDFGTISTGMTATHNVIVTNDGNSSGMVLANSNFTAPFSLNGCEVAQLGPGQSCTAHITFAPTTAGTFTHTLSIFGNNGQDYEIPITGTATGRITLGAAATNLLFTQRK